MELYCYDITCSGKAYRAVAETQLQAIEYADSFLRGLGIDKPLMAVKDAGRAWCKATPGCVPYHGDIKTRLTAVSYYHPGNWALGTGGR